MSETPTDPPVENEDTVSAGEQRRALGIQVGSNLAAQRGEGITELLKYADAVEKYLKGDGIESATSDIPEEYGPANPR